MHDGIATGLRLRPATRSDGPRVRALIESVLHEFGLAPDPQGTDRDLDDLEAAYSARGGRFDLLVDEDDGLAGCVGLYPLDATRVELRKMYLPPARRGQGLGRLLLEHALGAARDLGFRRVELETASRLVAAMALYERYGFARQVHGAHAQRCDRAYALDLSTVTDPG